MKKAIFLFLLYFSVYLNLIAENSLNSFPTAIAAKTQYSEFTAIPTVIEFEKGKELDINGLDYWLSQYFDENQMVSFKLISKQIDQLGYTHYRYQQIFNNIPVQHGYYVVHAMGNKIVSMNGLCFDKFSTAGPTKITEPDALKTALLNINAQKYKWEVEAEEILLKRQINDVKASYYPDAELVYVFKNGKKEEELVLAYKFTVYAEEPLSKHDVFIDAREGRVIKKENLLHEIDVLGTAKTVYSGTQKITTDSSTNGYVLRESGRGKGIETYNLKKGTSFSSAVDFVDKDNVWDSTNVDLDQYALDAHWGAEATYDYYLNKHNRNSINDSGFKLISMMHYGQNFVNAYWDGSKMIYGDGNGTIGPLVSLDVIGHEITHGLTSFSAKLLLENESGALNESFSDIFGVTIDWHTRPQKANWTLAEELSPYIRSLENPGVNNDPDTYFGTNWKTIGGADDGGIHSNSGVQNFWYYLLAMGGSGKNDIGNNYNVKGIGLDKSAQIAYRNLTVYLTSLSDFKEARYFSIQAASDLYGACSAEVEATTNAWFAVGVGEAYESGIKSNFAAPYTKTCAVPFTVNFENKSKNAKTYLWDFGDGTSSTDINPSHSYKKPGKYTVSLKGENDPKCGASNIFSAKDFIEISAPEIPVTDTISLCIKTPANIDSKGNGFVKWYDSKTDGNLLDTAKILKTAALEKDTSFFVEDKFYKIGETNVAATGVYNYDVRHQVFDVYKPIEIKSVVVNSFSQGDRIIQLRDNKARVLMSDTFYINKGIDTLDLNFRVYPGTDYQLGVSGTNIALGRSNTNLKYPYTIPNLMSIKRSNAKSINGIGSGLSYYYFFYDWEIKELDCSAERKEVKVKVQNCNAVPSLSLSGNIKTYYDPTNDKININPSKELLNSNLFLKVYNAVGACIIEKQVAADSHSSHSLAPFAKGLYFIEINDSQGCFTTKIIK